MLPSKIVAGIILLYLSFGIYAQNVTPSSRIPSSLEKLLKDRCIDCHDADTSKGDLDLTKYMTDFNIERDHDLWVEVESLVSRKKMPPPKKKPLTKNDLKVVEVWFEKQFVMPGGVQHAGSNPPRRLTREELQNTLEDILNIDLRVKVTNSRLHIIPESIIEKFFSKGILGKSGFSNDAATLNKEPINLQTYATCFSLILDQVDSSEKSRLHLFGTKNLDKVSLPHAQQIIGRFGRSAFRRSMTSRELEAYTGVYKTMLTRGSSYKALKSSFLAILQSPSFLYRFEEKQAGQVQVVGNELATRLSYFLWSSPPDKELLKLAASGELRKPSVLKAQVQRMLADTKRVALAENLGAEWFDYKKLRRQSSVNQRSDKMSGFYRTQYEESLLFFDSLLQYDQSIFSIVHSNWGFSNRHQSGIYKIKAKKKSFETKNSLPPVSVHFRHSSRNVIPGNYEYKHAPLELVTLNDANRGGFITIGSTLSATSTENRTSPIRRGAWVMERILGEHFKIPKDIPALEESEKKAKNQRLKLSANEILKLHSSQKGCAACHQYLDPIGFGLEHFDQLGISRPVSLNAKNIVGGELFQWKPASITKKFTKKTWSLKKKLKIGTDCKVSFQWTHGSQGLDVKNVRLESGKFKLLDAHTGFTGGKNRKNTWTFKIPKNAPATGWKLTAEVKGSKGAGSHGMIVVGPFEVKGEIFKLPNGKAFSSPGELKKELLAGYQNQIVNNIIRRVLAYALGRKIEPVDRPAIRKIKEKIKLQDYRLRAVIEEVVLSYPFRFKEEESNKEKR
jgi:hypothetical protein